VGLNAMRNPFPAFYEKLDPLFNECSCLIMPERGTADHPVSGDDLGYTLENECSHNRRRDWVDAANFQVFFQSLDVEFAKLTTELGRFRLDRVIMSGKRHQFEALDGRNSGEFPYGPQRISRVQFST